MIERMEKGIDILYRKYARDMFSYAVNLDVDRETAKDVVHDVFCKLYTEKRLLDNVTNVRAYLFQSVKNRLLDLYKSKRETLLPPDVNWEDMPFSVEVSVEDEFIETEEHELLRRKVEQLLSALTDRQREIIYLRYMQNLSYEEISEIMHITSPACRKLLHKVISKLRQSNFMPLILLFL
ncbi:MAG: RNA polymerase sigma factor [Tannerella sp.]|jgi:RNA polymerase sigma factor (sigma-70 family)|nr:RNA polymerase sigma factor [Tannerella sp.]